MTFSVATLYYITNLLSSLSACVAIKDCDVNPNKMVVSSILVELKDDGQIRNGSSKRLGVHQAPDRLP